MPSRPEAGTIAWPNGVDLAPEPLYEEARRNLVEGIERGLSRGDHHGRVRTTRYMRRRRR